MFLTSLLAATLTANVKPRIVGVSMFKNGYAVVTREVDTPEAGKYIVSSMPQASLGTLWFAATGGSVLNSVETFSAETQAQVPATNLDSILRLNVGKTLTFYTMGFPTNSFSGKLLSADGEIVVVERTGSTTIAVPKGQISSIALANASESLLYSQSVPSSTKGLRLTTGGSKGKVTMISLERGMTWAPAYAVDITDKKRLKLVAKATVVNDLEDLDGVEARFITGFPNVPFAQMVEPLVSGQSVDQFTAFLSQIGASMREPVADMMSQNAFAGGGGFGGRMASPGTGVAISPLAGEQAEDLYFYRQPDVHLSRGDRSYYVLFRAEADYREIYTWDIEDAVVNNIEYRMPNPGPARPEDVWHTLKFKNTSGQPLTTAPATTFHGGEILGQDIMHYVSPGGDAELRITKALDVHADRTEEEVSRERGAIRDQNNNPRFDLVNLKGTLSVTNEKTEKVQLRIQKALTGEFVSADGNPTVVKTAKGLRDINPGLSLAWDASIEPGQTLKIVYAYKLYVRSQ